MKAHERRGLVEERRRRRTRLVDGEREVRRSISWVVTEKGAARATHELETGDRFYF